MLCVPEAPVGRVDSRKRRTRAALIEAAQAFVAAGRLNAPILEITQAADVGMGSFYNHFATKEQLFEAAVTEALDAHGALLDACTAELDDPAEIFAAAFRLTGRLFRSRPQESRVLLANGMALLVSDRGLAPRALRDIRAGVAAGRFRVPDPELALAMAGGALLGLGNLLQAQPDRDDAHAADAVTADLLRLFGMTEDDAREICARPLPDLSVRAAAS
ncbi:TetR family transcriptional regulator [Mycolicibacterium sp. Y3]